MNIDVRIEPHERQTYETCGDYWWQFVRGLDGVDLETLEVRVSALGDWRMETLVAVHEIVEAAILKHHGIPEPAVTAFDIEFEAARAGTVKAGRFRFRGRWHDQNAEPGDSPEAPYRQEHCFATAVERMLAAALDIRWADYEDRVLALPPVK